ncbi:hypothetical protein [Paenibacillus soyae]|uniref:Copper amine oxidase-like N-terminal domain-containing protein n=1 Tax=Paenibacillus soyae TaxID=2969249 RepID=A0A9X2MVD7_9BACL|nr:hypothetical protein [Paenibacillus soyae]MCR2806551.1 hypothetical protein [Paenibacillus soyae]
MKLFMLIAILIGGVFGQNGAGSVDGQTGASAENVTLIQPLVSEAPPVAAAVHVIEGETASVAAQASVQVGGAVPNAASIDIAAETGPNVSDDAQVQDAANGKGTESSASASDERVLLLKSVGGISLYDTPESVVAKLGDPERIAQDELLSELKLYHYPSLTVAFYGEYVQYVDVPAGEMIVIDGKDIPMTEAGLTAYLGSPDYIAEDGIVFQRGEALLKLFIDSDTKKPIYASYYHIATV